MTRGCMIPLGAAVALSAMAVACGPAPVAREVERPKVRAENGGNLTDGVMFFRDPETGCEYLTYYSGGITPRYEYRPSRYERVTVRGCVS